MTTVRSGLTLAASNYSIDNQPAFAGRRKHKKKTSASNTTRQTTPTPVASGGGLSIGHVLKTLFFGWLLLSAGTGLGVSAKPLRSRGNCDPDPCPPEDSGNDASNSTAIAIQTLKCPPFGPFNTSMFTPQTYSDAPPLVPASARPLNETAIVEQLQDTLAQRFPHNETAVDNAMELFDNPQLVSVVPDARLRAALITLEGTAGEAAIESIQNGHFKEVAFANLTGNVVAVSRHDTSGQTKPSILFNERYEHEDFRLLAPTFMHETLHEDAIGSGREERANTILETEVYGQLVAEDPSLAQSGTELARRANTRLMAWTNSRNGDGEVRPFTAQAGNVFPGGRPLNNFASAFTRPDGLPINDTSPGNPTLREVLRHTTGEDIPQPNFDADTDTAIDQHQQALSPEKLVAVARDGLKLNTSCGQTEEPVEPTPPPVVSSAARSATPSVGLLGGLLASATLMLSQLWGRPRTA